MFREVTVRFTTLVALGCLAASALAPAAPAYRQPDLDKEIFKVKEISLDKFDRSGLVSALISVGRDFDDEDKVDYELRAHALAIAARLDPENERLKTTLAQLKADGTTISETNTKARVSSRLASGIRALTRKADAEANQLCAAYVCDVALRLEPKGESSPKIKESQDTLTKAGRKADWQGILGKVIVRQKNPEKSPPGTPIRRIIMDDEKEEVAEKKEVKMPGGTGKAFARNQNHANGLVVLQLEGGNFAGSASTVNATALREPGLDGLLFTFNQGVGSMMGGCLEEVVKFLRIRYDSKPEKIPNGFRIELGFQDKYVPKDGPSAATLFTIVLDSLFSGDELDEGFACTGDITADGMVQKIGGTSGKIRGATKRGCKIVGIPEGNGKEVADVLLMDGPDQLLNIQIFTMKNFDEAAAISRKTKSASVQAVLDSFTKIAEVVKARGHDILKNKEVQKRLDAIVSKMPNHLSAKLLLEYAKGTNPKVLTVGGSFKEIQGASSGIFKQLGVLFLQIRGEKDKIPTLTITEEQQKEAKESVATIKKLSSNIDPKLKTFTEAVINVCQAYADGPKTDEKPEDFSKRLKDGMEKVQTANEKLLKDPSIMEDLMD
ncbi:MAG: hypothetical protein NTW21_34060 [Verrucomicrobia bacterium]|nr:hypothetical protein [Verrucomicrobiota bacterium]